MSFQGISVAKCCYVVGKIIIIPDGRWSLRRPGQRSQQARKTWGGRGCSWLLHGKEHTSTLDSLREKMRMQKSN